MAKSGSGALLRRALSACNDGQRLRGLLWRMMDRTWICVLLAIAIGCIQPLRDVFENGALRWVGDSW